MQEQDPQATANDSGVTGVDEPPRLHNRAVRTIRPIDIDADVDGDTTVVVEPEPPAFSCRQEELEQTVDVQLAERVLRYRDGDSWREITDVSIGVIGRLSGVEIVQVINETQALAILNNDALTPALLDGWSTANSFDGRRVSLPVAECTGTYSYEPAIGGTRTVPVFKPFDDTDHLLALSLYQELEQLRASDRQGQLSFGAAKSYIDGGGDPVTTLTYIVETFPGTHTAVEAQRLLDNVTPILPLLAE